MISLTLLLLHIKYKRSKALLLILGSIFSRAYKTVLIWSYKASSLPGKTKTFVLASKARYLRLIFFKSKNITNKDKIWLYKSKVTTLLYLIITFTVSNKIAPVILFLFFISLIGLESIIFVKTLVRIGLKLGSLLVVNIERILRALI